MCGIFGGNWRVSGDSLWLPAVTAKMVCPACGRILPAPLRFASWGGDFQHLSDSAQPFVFRGSPMSRRSPELRAASHARHPHMLTCMIAARTEEGIMGIIMINCPATGRDV